MVEFNSYQRRALRKFLERSPSYTNENSAENFLLRYVFFEALCRHIGKYYKERVEVRKRKAKKSYESMQIDVVARSFAYFGIQIRFERLTYLLDSSLEKRNQKSARNLRNGIVHRWDENDVAEASERYSNLCLALDAVVDAISHRVNGGRK